jgi:hypothetical protein
MPTSPLTSKPLRCANTIKVWGAPTKKLEGDLDLISKPKLLLEGGKGLGRMGHYCHHPKN